MTWDHSKNTKTRALIRRAWDSSTIVTVPALADTFMVYNLDVWVNCLHNEEVLRSAAQYLL